MSSTLGKFYSVGVGPGDPHLITYKAVDTIKTCDVIAVPESGGSENVALKIAKEHVQGKEILVCDMPMVRDKNKLDEYHTTVTNSISACLDKGRSVAFLTLGDPSIYSTTLYIHNRLAEKGYATEIIPGVPSFCAVAASLNTPLCEGREPLHIIPASYEGAEELLSLSGNKVLMKSGKSLGSVLNKLKEQSETNRVMMVERASMEDEKVYLSIDDIAQDASYFSIIIVKNN